MNDRKKPEIRFKEFHDDWEQRKFDDFVTFYSGLTYAPNDVQDSGTLVLRSSNVKDGEVISADDVYVNPSKATSENVKSGDLIVVVRNGSRALIGKHAQIKRSMPNTVIGAFMTGIRSDHSEFVNALLDTPQFKKEVDMNMGATINQITGYMFSQMEFMVPSEVEQDKLGGFFKDLDNCITLHQNKCAEPPRSRNFSLAISWEQRKLGDCFEERNENMPNGELISVTINEGIKKFSELGRHDNSNEDKSKYKKVCVGDIAYNSMRMWQGASGCSPYEGIVSPAYTVLKPKDGTDSKCVSYLFKRQDMVHTFQLNSQGITSDNWNLKFPALSQIEIKLPPEIDEQKKIAAYFTDLDRLITLHQREQNHIQIYDYRSILHGSF